MASNNEIIKAYKKTEKASPTWILFECNIGGSRFSETLKAGDMLAFYGQTKDGDECGFSGCACQQKGRLIEAARVVNYKEACDWFRRSDAVEGA